MDIHDLLDSFIDRKSPRPARFLYSMWSDQQKAVTYHELRDAILDGSLSRDYLSNWQQDYSIFLTECYGPVVDEAAKAAHEMLTAQYGGYLQDPMHGLMDDHIRYHGGRLIREVSEGQYRAINTLVRQATLTDTLTVDELARCIRPCIGLTQNQAQRVKKFYEQLREDGYSKKDALKKETNFAAKLHRQRAALIAQTELAYAANEGMDAVIRQNVEQGIISPEVEKEWSTARDERVCPVCGGLHGERVAENEPFSNGVMLPPAHPGCRCAVKYHLKAPERPKNPELVDDSPLHQQPVYGIIQSEEPQTIHTAEDTEWLRTGYDSAVQRGNLSALTGFDNYEQVAKQVEDQLVGLETFDGIKIEGFQTHFIDRVIGDYNSVREPVDIEDIKQTLLSEKSKIINRTERGGKLSRRYISNKCEVSLNPDSKLLVQTTPKKKGGTEIGKAHRKAKDRISGFISRRIRWLNRAWRL